MRDVTLYDRQFGNLGSDIHGGVSRLNPEGSHNTVYGDGHHFSWDQDNNGEVSNEHFVDDGYRNGPNRHPFDK